MATTPTVPVGYLGNPRGPAPTTFAILVSQMLLSWAGAGAATPAIRDRQHGIHRHDP